MVNHIDVRMPPVCNERSGANLTADSNAEDGRRLVSDESDDCVDNDPADVFE